MTGLDRLAVIVPCLNGEAELSRLLAQLPKHVRRVVSDGGSSDGSLRIALRGGAVIASGAAGRGSQLSRGADLAIDGAKSDIEWLLFLHADTVLSPGWDSVIAQHMSRGGKPAHFRYAPRLQGDGRGMNIRLMRAMVRLREAAWGLPYGDQGLLISVSDYRELGGYHHMPLFEDVDMVTRIKRRWGRLTRLKSGVDTDISDYLRDGVWRRGWRNLKLLSAYRHGTPVEELIQRYKGAP